MKQKTLLRGLNIWSSLAALVLFLLPWVEIRCSQKTVVSQSGLQMITGSLTVAPDFKADWEEDGRKLPNGRSKEHALDSSITVAFALCLAVGAFCCALMGVKSKKDKLQQASGAMSATALATLLILTLRGFPIEEELNKALHGGRSQSKDDGPLAQVAAGLSGVVGMNVHIQRLSAFHFELLALAISSLGLLSTLGKKVNSPRHGESTSEK